MRVTVPRGEFADAAGWVARHLPARAVPEPGLGAALPPLGLGIRVGMLLEAGERSLTLSVFDHQVAVSATLDVPAAVAGRALLPGRLVAEIVRSLPDDQLSLVVDEGFLLVRSAGAQYRVPTLPLDDYPALPEFPPLVGEVDTIGFASAAVQVAPAAARDDTFPVLTALRLEFGARQLVFVATDRYRLAVRAIPWSPSVRAPRAVAHVPARLLAEFARIPTSASRLALGLGTDDEDGAARFGLSTGTRRVVVRLVDGAAFPHYQRIFPASVPLAGLPLVAVAQVAALTAAVRRVAVVAPRARRIVRITLADGRLTAHVGPEADLGAASDAEPLATASATDCVEVDYTGPELVAWYNSQFLLDGLTAVDGDEVTIGFTAPDPLDAARAPAILAGKDDDGFRYVLMPFVRREAG